MLKTTLLLIIAAAFLVPPAQTSGAVSPAPQNSPEVVPMEKEPHHHVLFRNDFIEVIHATIPPGESTLFHTHSHDSVGFDLAQSTSAEQFVGKPEESPVTSQVGAVWAWTPTDEPYIHRVHNVGHTQVESFDVELLQRPARASASVAARVAAENASARVYKWMLAPGATSAMHTHERPYLIIAATPFKLKMTAPDGQSFTDNVKAGDFHWVDSKTAHALTNEDRKDAEIVEIELK